MAKQHALRVLTGTTAQRLAITPNVGEIVLDSTLLAGGTATALFGGDNATAGGLPISPAAGVSSVFGRPGAVAAAAGDYTAGQVTNVPTGALAATNVQAALDELQADITSINTVNASNYIAGAGAPGAGVGQDGYFYLDATSGDVYGAKAAGAWPASTTNVYSQLGLSAVAGAAPAAAGAAGTGTVAARSDHVHPFQSAANTPSSAAGNLVATNVDAALAELQAELDTATAASHAHANKAAIDTIPTPLVGAVGEVLTVTGAGIYGTAAVPSAPVATVHGRTGVVIGVNGDYTAANVTNVPSGNLVSTEVQAALNELQGDIDTLNTVNASNYIAGAGAPAAGVGQDGFFYLDATSGDVYGAKAAGAWPASTTNVYSQLGLSATAGAASAAAGAAGVATVAARGDHVHPFQSAANTASTAVGNLAATNVDAALAELQADIDTRSVGTVTLTAGLGLTGGGDLTADRTFDVDVTGLTAVTTHVGTDEIIIQTAAGVRKITVDNFMNAGTLP